MITNGSTRLSFAEKHILFMFFAILFLLFFRPMEALRLDVYNPDSACYADWLYRFFGSSFWNCKYNYYYPGAAFIWIPAAVLGYGLSLITHLPKEVWIEPLVGLTTFSAFIAAVVVNIKSYRLLNGKGLLAPILLCLAAPVLPYASIHTFLAHSTEFLFASLTVYYLLARKLPGVLIFGLLVSATRPTGCLTFLFVTAYLWDDYRTNPGGAIILKRSNRIWIASALTIGLVLLVRTLLKGYGVVPKDSTSGTFVPSLLSNVNFSEVVRFLVGDRNGMLFTGPWWLLVLALGALSLPRLSWTSRAAVAWMAGMALICIGWGGNGSQGGWFIFYRYLTATYMGALFVCVELCQKVGPTMKRVLWGVLGWQALVVCYLSWMNNYAVPRFWEFVTGQATWSEIVRKHLALAIFTPAPLTVFSWWPGLSKSIYGGEHFLSGPSLWLLTGALMLSLLGFLYHYRHFSSQRRKE